MRRSCSDRSDSFTGVCVRFRHGAEAKGFRVSVFKSFLSQLHLWQQGIHHPALQAPEL